MSKTDDELRRKVQSTIYGDLSLLGIGQDVEAENCVDHIMKLIQARDEQREIDIRIDELQALPHSGFINMDGIRFDVVSLGSLNGRIAELQALKQEKKAA